MHALVCQLPLDRIMLETDAPYLTPHPHRGKRNQPAYIPLIAQAIAVLLQVSVDEVARTSSALAMQTFKKCHCSRVVVHCSLLLQMQNKRTYLQEKIVEQPSPLA
ncbi:MAG: TatD family hydrolase [Caldilineales bacterium]